MSSTTWILIHGGCHGEWCWDGVRQLMLEAGHRAVAFDMPGCGADRTPRGEVNLARQVARAVAQIDAVQAEQVHVVGHSIAGWVLPALVAARRPRISEVVYLAASVLDVGERGIDVTPAERRPGYYESAQAAPDFSVSVSLDVARDRFFNHLDDAHAQAAYDLLTPQPFQPYLDPAEVGPVVSGVSARYIAMDDDRTYPDQATAEFAAKVGAQRVVIPGDHCVMLSAPDVLTRALLAGTGE